MKRVNGEKIILSLGSNMGNRKENIKKALFLLKESGFEIDKISSFYETEPVGFKDQGYFINLVVSGGFGGEPEELLYAINTIEDDLGRVRVLKYGPRTIDIDIIFFGRRTVESDSLTIPHPEYKKRLFVLFPLIEIEPEIMDESCGKAVRTILKECDDRCEVKKTETIENEIQS